MVTTDLRGKKKERRYWNLGAMGAMEGLLGRMRAARGARGGALWEGIRGYHNNTQYFVLAN